MKNKMTAMWNWLLLVVISNLCDLTRTMHIKESFRDVNHMAFRQMEVHKTSGNVFIGADNKLLKLSPKLEKLDSAYTGPREDNPNCPPPLLPCDEEKYDNVVSHSKGIAIDNNENVIIACSSLFHGFCEKRLLSNLTATKRYIFKPMVPNDLKSSSVVFMAPGPSSSSSTSASLYIAATHSNQGLEAYRNLVPAISARDPQTFEYSYRDSIGGSYKRIDKSVKQDFLVSYVHGFSHEDYIYFISVQRQNFNSPNYVTKLIRLCQKDKYFNSYIEMQLTCQNDSLVYNAATAAILDVPKPGSVQSASLFVTFNESSDSASSDGNTAVCVYEMDDIQGKLDFTIKSCYNGVGTLGPSHIHPLEPCKASGEQPDLCGTGKISQEYPAMEVSAPLTTKPIFMETGPTFTAIATSSVSDETVIFLGLSNGVLKKVALALDGNWTTVEEVQVGYGKPISSQLYLTNDGTSLYSMTEDKVVLIDVADCHLRTTCSSCMSVKDPYCGWCVMSNTCTKSKDCGTSEVKPPWIASSSGQCPKISNLSPTALSVEQLEIKSDQISFLVSQVDIPSQANLDVKCVFANEVKAHVTKTMMPRDSQVTCDIPSLDELPALKPKSDHSDLKLRVQIGGKTVVSRNISLYDCRVHKTCSVCTSSEFACQWCAGSHLCMNSVSDSCPGQSTPGVKTTDNCAMLKNPASDIVVHSGEQKEVFAELPNLQVDQTQQLKCKFSYLGKSEVVRASYTGGRVYCDRLKFEYDDAETPYVMSSFQVTWGPKEFVLDNPENVQVRIYKCPLMVTNCGKCLTMDPEYNCGWCGNSCTLRIHCPGDWLDRDSTCPDPQILRFNPTSGPVGGKTNVSVTGINLGKTVADIQGGVQVAGVKCVVEQNNYEASSGFTCETVPTPFDNSGVISVQVSSIYDAESDSDFKYVDPSLKSIEPKRGPVSGGTTLVVTGSHMNTGSSVTVTINGNPCKVVRSNSSALEFTTPPHAAEGLMDVTVSFGGAEKTLAKSFQYVADPKIVTIEPQTTILSGGTTLSVLGSNLDIIDHPKMVVRTQDGQSKTVMCQKKNEYRIHCTVPSMKEKNYDVSNSSPGELQYGFLMDSVKSLERISETSAFGPLLYYPDPKVKPFPEDDSVRTYVKDEMLTIEGEFVNMDHLISDVMILVGSDVCIRPSGTASSLSCEPPTSPGGRDADNKAPVQVRIGNFRAQVGYLKYYDGNSSEKPIALGIILGVVLPILAIITLLSICVIRRHLKHGPSDTQNYLPDVLRDEEEKKEEEIALSLVNGDISNDKETSGFVTEVLSGLEDEHVQQNARQMLLSRRKLDLGDLLGKGHYGSVYKAEFRRADDEEPVTVAVKSLQATNKDVKSMQNFLGEAVVVKDLNHPNILSVLGVCISPNDSPLIVLPLLTNGDLRSYIKDTSKKLTVIELLQFAEQISDGMNYLSGLLFIHRNLAARNCLLNENLKVQLTDYGLTKDLFDKNHISNTGNSAKILYKWMAPENLKSQEYSLQTDVWSFGIVLWELMTRGITPYPDVEPEGLQAYLDGGNRMKKPKHCPEFVYDLMCKCWQKAPEDRPVFLTLHEDLSKWVSQDGDGQSNGKNNEKTPLYAKVECAGSTEYLDVIG